MGVLEIFPSLMTETFVQFNSQGLNVLSEVLLPHSPTPPLPHSPTPPLFKEHLLEVKTQLSNKCMKDN